MDKLILTWNDFDDAVIKMADKIKFNHPDYRKLSLFGLPRGGLCLAVALSHKLDIPMETGYPFISWDNTIVIDDIIETGNHLNTLVSVRNISNVYTWVYKTNKHNGIAKARTTSILYEDTDRWIVFPWESQADWEKDMKQYKENL